MLVVLGLEKVIFKVMEVICGYIFGHNMVNLKVI